MMGAIFRSFEEPGIVHLEANLKLCKYVFQQSKRRRLMTNIVTYKAEEDWICGLETVL